MWIKFKWPKFSLRVLLSICLFFFQFRPAVAYKSVAYKKKRVYTFLSLTFHCTEYVTLILLIEIGVTVVKCLSPKAVVKIPIQPTFFSDLGRFTFCNVLRRITCSSFNLFKSSITRIIYRVRLKWSNVFTTFQARIQHFKEVSQTD